LWTPPLRAVLIIVPRRSPARAGQQEPAAAGLDPPDPALPAVAHPPIPLAPAPGIRYKGRS
ncbi:MAG: hypothetical protein ACE5GW_08990, partial [Planctomycetota bacterium]